MFETGLQENNRPMLDRSSIRSEVERIAVHYIFENCNKRCSRSKQTRKFRKLLIRRRERRAPMSRSSDGSSLKTAPTSFQNPVASTLLRSKCRTSELLSGETLSPICVYENE